MVKMCLTYSIYPKALSRRGIPCIRLINNFRNQIIETLMPTFKKM